MAPDPNRRPDEPKPPRDRVAVLTDGRDVAVRATWVRPVLVPALRLSAVRKVPGLEAERYKGCGDMKLLPESMEPIM